MITVTHTCGHTQATNLDRIARGAPKMLGKSEEQFIREQVEFLEANLCPECYRRAKELDPSTKTVGG